MTARRSRSCKRSIPTKPCRVIPDSAVHLAQTAIGAEFDPSISHRMKLDHGFCVPLWRMGLDPVLPIVPVVVNDLEPPMPTLKRCIAFGQMLRRAIDSYPEDLRVVALGTGGLSHSIGEPTMGEIDEPFDELCIDLFNNADDDAPRRRAGIGAGQHRKRRRRGPELGDLATRPPAARAST